MQISAEQGLFLREERDFVRARSREKLNVTMADLDKGVLCKKPTLRKVGATKSGVDLGPWAPSRDGASGGLYMQLHYLLITTQIINRIKNI